MLWDKKSLIIGNILLIFGSIGTWYDVGQVTYPYIHIGTRPIGSPIVFWLGLICLIMLILSMRNKISYKKSSILAIIIGVISAIICAYYIISAPAGSHLGVNLGLPLPSFMWWTYCTVSITIWLYITLIGAIILVSAGIFIRRGDEKCMDS